MTTFKEEILSQLFQKFNRGETNQTTSPENIFSRLINSKKKFLA